MQTEHWSHYQIHYHYAKETQEKRSLKSRKQPFTCNKYKYTYMVYAKMSQKFPKIHWIEKFLFWNIDKY